MMMDISTSCERLSDEWSGQRLHLPFVLGCWQLVLPVIGWTDANGGSPCQVHVVKTRYYGALGFLVYGGNQGVRVLDNDSEPVERTIDRFSRGWIQPFIWVECADDLPQSVQKIVSPVC